MFRLRPWKQSVPRGLPETRPDQTRPSPETWSRLQHSCLSDFFWGGVREVWSFIFGV